MFKEPYQVTVQGPLPIGKKIIWLKAYSTSEAILGAMKVLMEAGYNKGHLRFKAEKRK